MPEGWRLGDVIGGREGQLSTPKQISLLTGMGWHLEAHKCGRVAPSELVPAPDV